MHSGWIIPIWVVAGLALPASAAPAENTQPIQPIKTVGDASRGDALAHRWCSSCHLLEGGTTANDAAPTFQWISREAQKDPGYIRVFLTRPHAPMPPLQLSRGEIEDFVAYFRTLATHNEGVR